MGVERRQSQFGTAFVEAAGVMLILLTLVLGVVGLIDYAHHTVQAKRILEQHLSESAVKPLKLEGLGSSMQLLPNHDAIQDYLDRAVSDAESALQAATSSESEDYRIEAGYALVSIDTAEGAALGLANGVEHIATRGSLQPDDESWQDQALGTLFQQAVDQSISIEGPAAFAAPAGGIAWESVNENFLPFSAVIGMRIALNLETTSLGRAYELIGREPLHFSYRTLFLRGDIS